MIKNLVFDLGGVFLHLDRDESVRRFKQLGISNIEELLDPYLQRGCFLGIEDGSLDEEAFALELEKIAGHPLSQEEIADAYLGFIKEVQSYKFDYIDGLADRFPIYILSNTNPYILAFTESEDFLPNGRKLSSYCKRKFASCEMGLVKPSREIFEAMIQEAQLKPEETLFIDDGEKNIETAKALGFQTYLAKNGEDWREDIEQLINI